MIKEWFTARELANYALSEAPNTKMGIIKKAKRENWQDRKRIAAGGGKEYHISNLSDDTQMELLEKMIGTENMNMIKNDCSFMDYSAPEKPIITNEMRRNAKVVIVALFDKFRASSHLKILKAEQAFLKFYAKQIESKDFTYVPEWVADIYPKFSLTSLRLWRQKRQRGALTCSYRAFIAGDWAAKPWIWCGCDWYG